jgi:hypothetical protein
MVYRKGERSNRHREAEFPFAVDIPVPRTGLGENLTAVLSAVQACPVRAESWSHSTQVKGEIRQWWLRIGTSTASEADRFAALFGSLDARRTR